MQYFRPSSLSEALSLLKKYGEGAIPVAGGTFFMSHKEELFTEIEVLVDIKNLGLSYIKEDSEGLKIGATTHPASILESGVAGKGAFSVIHEALLGPEIPEIRNMGTLDGDLFLSAEVDMSVPLMALEAKLLIAGSDGKRTLSTNCVPKLITVMK